MVRISRLGAKQLNGERLVQIGRLGNCDRLKLVDTWASRKR